MHLFKVRLKGERNFTPIIANNRIEAAMKFRHLIESRKMTAIQNSSRTAKRLFKGR